MPPSITFYQYFDFVVSADFPLVELPSADEGPAHFQIRMASGGSHPIKRQEWDWEWLLPSGDVFLSVAHQEDGCCLQFPGILDVEYRKDEDSIELTPGDSASDETVRHLLLDHVLPRLVSHQGRLVLHSAAVADHEGAILLLGPTGAGKSTLAASYLEDGYELLTDDCVLLDPTEDGIRAIPAYPGLRLWPDSMVELVSDSRSGSELAPMAWKSRINVGPGSGIENKVRALLLLEEPSESEGHESVSLLTLQGSAALMELLQHGFMLDPGDRDTIEKQFLAVGDLAESLPLFRLTYPRDFSKLAEVRQSITRVLAGELGPGQSGPRSS